MPAACSADDALDDFPLAGAEPLAQLGERRDRQRHVGLQLAEQPPIELRQLRAGDVRLRRPVVGVDLRLHDSTQS